MKRLIYILVVITTLVACEDDYYIDTGIADGNLDMSMWEYFQTSSYNWDSTMLVISRAGMESLFQSESTDAQDRFTFLGVTNHSIRKFMLDNGYETVSDIPVEICEEYIKDYIIPIEYTWEDIDFEVKGTTTNEGGTLVENTNGNSVRLFRRKSDYGAVVDAGPVSTFAQSFSTSKTVQLVSTNIQTNSGVVHALSYTHSFSPF